MSTQKRRYGYEDGEIAPYDEDGRLNWNEEYCAVVGDDEEEKARRLVALLNLSDGIPTEMLESGVVVVPMELIDAVRSVVEAHREECESGSDTGVVHKLEHLYDVFSRLQQNGGENACGN